MLVIEDNSATGTLLERFLQHEIERMLTVPDPRKVSRNPGTGDKFPDSDMEPGQGQLVHLGDPIASIRASDYAKVALPENRAFRIHEYPNVRVFDLDDAEGAMVAAAAGFKPTYGYNREDSSSSSSLRRLIDRYRPDILVVDLAISAEEGPAIEAEGIVQIDASKPPATLPDPRLKLRELTGFKILRAYSRICPVIVTSSLSNPLAVQHCMVNGAFAYVLRPVPHMNVNSPGYDFETVTRDLRTLDAAAKAGRDPLAVVVNHYLTMVAAEVVKAMYAKYLTEMPRD